MIHWFMRSGLLKEAIDFFEEMEDKGCMADDVTFNTMVQGFLQNNKIYTAIQFLNEMAERNFLTNARTTSMITVLVAKCKPDHTMVGMLHKFLSKG
ncbi:hypothetical protein GIB67_003493 [Kingdonia uniflora]|uniref:Pentatricopeptide repeat-containing protein n=1 Tax=Kingdonia uniflora TaxID=39325 RepID=A0A7J7MEG6_9MAGN|nr:hypothetical protein GIB67_003493 [Kingdonia uniflora]